MVCASVLTKETSTIHDAFRNSEWEPEAAKAMCKEVRTFKIPGGKDGQLLTLGSLIDRTPKELISKVMLEKKVLDTWYGGRTVLLGDGRSKQLCSLLFMSKNTQWSRNRETLV